MRVSFVSDIHGNVDGLARVAAAADQLIVLGDLIDYVDYHDHDQGILGEVFGAEAVGPFARLRSSGDFAALRDYNASLWDSVEEPAEILTDVVRRRYRQIVDVLPPDTLLTLGNVDVLGIWTEVASDQMPLRDAEVVTRGGHRFGFVGGGSTRPGYPFRRSTSPWQPFVRAATEYEDAVRALGPIDVLCAHIPPRIPALRYDVIPARMEMFGPGLLEAIDEHQPRLAVFGHVHQPLARRIRRGRTECVNVGHFQRFPVAFEVELD